MAKTLQPTTKHLVTPIPSRIWPHLKYAKGKNKSWQQADKLVKRYLLQRWGKLQAA
jgi:hypothetical protein